MKRMNTVDHLNLVVDYLNQKIDIYDGKHEKTIIAWNNAWDEMKFQGYKPDTVQGIKKYIAANYY